MIRQMLALAILPIMKATGFRFSRSYRHEATLYHQAIYRMIDTVGANVCAEGAISVRKLLFRPRGE